jgi:hypothetical protein
MTINALWISPAPEGMAQAISSKEIIDFAGGLFDNNLQFVLHLDQMAKQQNTIAV